MSMATTPSSHPDWVQQYQQRAQAAAVGSPYQFSRGPAPSSASAAESTVVTTVTTASPPSSAATASAPAQQPQQQAAAAAAAGRGARPARRRTRASRRTPTTLLNTDTTNFRAMVHQFTGAPLAPAPPSAAFPTPFYLSGAGPGTSLVDFSQLPLQQQQQGFAGAQVFQVPQQQQHHQQLLDGGLFGVGPNATGGMETTAAAYFHGLGGGGGPGDQRS